MLYTSKWWRIGTDISKLEETAGHLYWPPDTCRRLLVDITIGSQRLILPPTQYKWNNVFKRFSRWCANRVWGKTPWPFFWGGWFTRFCYGWLGCESVCLCVRSRKQQGWGRDKGSFSWNIHALCCLGHASQIYPDRWTEGESKQAIPLCWQTSTHLLFWRAKPTTPTHFGLSCMSGE